jgi:hypothetical protein
MERAKIVKDEIRAKHTFSGSLCGNKKCVFNSSKREEKTSLEHLAIAVPKPRDMPGPVSSSVLLGDKNAISARMFAEYLLQEKENSLSFHILGNNQRNASTINFYEAY